MTGGLLTSGGFGIQLVQLYNDTILMNHTLFQTMRLDPRSGLPIYIQIIEQIKQQIADGRLHPGDAHATAPVTERQLGGRLLLEKNPYRMLDESGVISTQQGRGT